MEKALKFAVVKKDSQLADLIGKVNKNCENMKTLSEKAKKILQKMVKICDKLRQKMEEDSLESNNDQIFENISQEQILASKEKRAKND